MFNLSLELGSPYFQELALNSLPKIFERHCPRDQVSQIETLHQLYKF